jgi:hypothetical protein
MGRISMAARDELVAAVAGRYARATRLERGRILDEFVAVIGLHRKHAMRLLRGGQLGQQSGPRPGRRIYDEAVRETLIVVWEASDRICGKRLRPLMPTLVEAMQRHGHVQLAPQVRTGLLAMSAATMERALQKVKGQAGNRTGRRAPSSAVVRRSVPVRTFEGWDDPAPGFVEADLVAHGGPTAKGRFVQTLTLTDIATGWTECAPLLVREQRLLTEVLDEVRKLLPFSLLGFDTDNDSVFMNETVRDYCKESGIEFTWCRSYRKNDRAWVEQKNGAVVRRIVGYRRFEGLEAAGMLARLYPVDAVVREPLPALVQAGRQVARRCEGEEALPSTGDALPASAGRPADKRRGAWQVGGGVRHTGPGSAAAADTLGPARSCGDRRQEHGGKRGRRGGGTGRGNPGAVPVRAAHGVAGRRGAPDQQAEGEGQARASAPGPVRRGDGTGARVVRGGAMADVARAVRAAVAEHPGIYPDGQLRTLQRRLKGWRRDVARTLVFGSPLTGDEEQAAAATGAEA